MSGQDIVQIGFYLVLLLVAVEPLGAYMARVYSGARTPLDRVLGPLERGLYRLAGVDGAAEMTWKQYALALLAFNGVGFLALYLDLRLQGLLPLNPQGFGGVEPHTALNTWQPALSPTRTGRTTVARPRSAI
ncbi:MAG: potassium-transporting ATPase subunit KdpA [Bryobacterales bacterium]